jgi:hypothetical protein
VRGELLSRSVTMSPPMLISDGTPRAVPTVQHLPVEFDGRKMGHLTVHTPEERDEWECARIKTSAYP